MIGCLFSPEPAHAVNFDRLNVLARVAGIFASHANRRLWFSDPNRKKMYNLAIQADLQAI